MTVYRAGFIEGIGKGVITDFVFFGAIRAAEKEDIHKLTKFAVKMPPPRRGTQL